MSPTVRRMRLGAEIEQLRIAAGLKPEELGERIGYSRAKVSRLENARERPSEAVVAKILDVLGVDGVHWSQLLAVTHDAAAEGWWTPYSTAMGQRQALHGDLEWNAATIREYQLFVPGLLQTETFAAHQQALGWPVGAEAEFVAERAVEARMMRQKMLQRREDSTYSVVIDEIAVRRLAAPPEVVAEQLEHIVDLSAEPRFTIRVLPVAARIEGYLMAPAAFSTFTYPDPLDPQVVAVDTVTSDLVLTTLAHEKDVTSYVTLYERLEDASLPVRESTDLIRRVAQDLREGATS